MNKFIFILLAISLLLSACASSSTSQVTVTSEVTVTSSPPPTETPIPTPTLHPQFAALQEQIAASGGRFVLNPDGTISDGAEPLPGLTVAPDGTMTLTIDGETVTLDPTKAVFDDENGFSYPGYEQDADGNWVEAISPGMKQLNEAVDNLVKMIDTFAVGESDGTSIVLTDKKNGEVKFSFTIGQETDGTKTLVDPVTGEVVYKDGSWEPLVHSNMIVNSGSCKVTKWVLPNVGPGLPTTSFSEFDTKVVKPLINAYTTFVKEGVVESSGLQFSIHHLGQGCWGVVFYSREDQKDAWFFWKDTNGRTLYNRVFLNPTSK